MKIVIQVTQSDIDAGHRGSCYDCPIALALNRSLGQQTFIWSDGELCIVADPDNGRKTKIGKLPVVARDFIDSFDVVRKGRAKPAPFMFTVDVPPRFIKRKLRDFALICIENEL